MPGVKRRHLSTLLAVTLLLGLAAPAMQAQSLAEVARKTREKNEKSDSKVWTNDDIRESLPELRLLGPPREHPPNLAIYQGSPYERIRQMLTVAGVKQDEVVIDVGSGDGRIVLIAASEFGARGIGIEIDENLVKISRAEAETRGLQERVKIVHANALDVDLSPADVVTLYLTDEGLRLLRPHLEHTLRPGTRVVSYVSQVPGWTPLPESVKEAEIWLYRIP